MNDQEFVMIKTFFTTCFLAISIFAFAQERRSCDCFDTEISLARDTLNSCRYYEFTVRNDGACLRGLSNFTMEIECGEASDIWSSLNTPIENNLRDPNNGLSGFKVDGIQGFGEDMIPDSFVVGFTFCPDDDYCADLQSYWEPIVAYKAGQCIIYDTLDLSFLPGFQPQTNLAPNPSNGPMSFTFTTPGPGYAKLEILDLFGNILYTPMSGDFKRQQRLHPSFDTRNLQAGLYLYKVSTPYGNSTGRFVVE